MLAPGWQQFPALGYLMLADALLEASQHLMPVNNGTDCPK